MRKPKSKRKTQIRSKNNKGGITHMKTTLGFFLIISLAVFVVYCSSDNSVSDENKNAELPDVFSRFVNEVNIFVDGQSVVLESKGVPNHSSPYWGVGNANYEAPHAGMVVNPNSIAEQNLVFRIPLNPEIAASISNTPLGPIGISVNGVALFNQFAGPSQPLENEIATFDRYHGHPQQTGQYHYHIEPLFFSNDDNSLVGFLLDGFPVYGQKDRDGTYPTDLDDANGHVGVTLDYSEGIYHYHITSDEPYISGGFRGTSGTVSQ